MARGTIREEAARVKRGLGTREKISRPRAHRPRIRLELRGPRLPAALPPLPAPGERAHASRQQEHDLSPERNAELVQQLPLRSQDETGNAFCGGWSRPESSATQGTTAGRPPCRAAPAICAP